MDELNALPYLDAVRPSPSLFLLFRCLWLTWGRCVRVQVVLEALRLNSPVPDTIRSAERDDVIPLSRPIVGRDGSLISELRVQKGQRIIIRACPLPFPRVSCLLCQMLMSGVRWEQPSRCTTGPSRSGGRMRAPSAPSGGSRASPPRPRTSRSPTATRSAPLPPPLSPPTLISSFHACIAQADAAAAQLTFLGGVRGCIAHRFAVQEIKSILFFLIRDLVFEEPSPRVEYVAKTTIVQHPRIKGKEELGTRMLLKVRAAT